MFNIKKLVSQALLALSLVFAAGGVLAGPTYQVSINTTAFAGSVGFVDFALGNLFGAPSATATLSNFSGAFGAEADRIGEVTGDIPGTISISNAAGYSSLLQQVTFGGLFTFDLSFDGDFMTQAGDGTTFGVGLLNQDMSEYLGADFNVLVFELVPPALGEPGSVSFTQADLVNVNVVPEPSALLLMLLALSILFVMRRRLR